MSQRVVWPCGRRWQVSGFAHALQAAKMARRRCCLPMRPCAVSAGRETANKGKALAGTHPSVVTAKLQGAQSCSIEPAERPSRVRKCASTMGRPDVAFAGAAPAAVRSKPSGCASQVRSPPQASFDHAPWEKWSRPAAVCRDRQSLAPEPASQPGTGCEHTSAWHRGRTAKAGAPAASRTTVVCATLNQRRSGLLEEALAGVWTCLAACAVGMAEHHGAQIQCL